MKWRGEAGAERTSTKPASRSAAGTSSAAYSCSCTLCHCSRMLSCSAWLQPPAAPQALPAPHFSTCICPYAKCIVPTRVSWHWIQLMLAVLLAVLFGRQSGKRRARWLLGRWAHQQPGLCALERGIRKGIVKDALERRRRWVHLLRACALRSNIPSPFACPSAISRHTRTPSSAQRARCTHALLSQERACQHSCCAP